MRTVKELNADVDPDRVRAFGAIRRMAITLTAKVLWQLVGFRMPDGSTPTTQAEPFTGIGFYARPPASGSAEAIVVMVGDAKTPAIVAARDEKTRAASAGDLGPDESAIFNTLVRVALRSGGTIELARIGLPTEPMVKGQTYRGAEDTMFTALEVVIDALGLFASTLAAAVPTLTGTPVQQAAFTASVAPLAAALTAFNAALATFQGAAATYLSQVGKVG